MADLRHRLVIPMLMDGVWLDGCMYIDNGCSQEWGLVGLVDR